MSKLLSLAQSGANSPANQFLRDNPLIVGLVFVPLGGMLLYFGLKEWKAGVARTKYGREMTGTAARLIAGVRILAGLIAGGFGLFKVGQGLF